jgi:hypothetical protein
VSLWQSSIWAMARAAVDRMARSQAVLVRSAHCISTTLTSIERSRRRILPVVRGGALADEPSDSSYVRDRIRRFFPPPTWKAPRVYGGPSMGHRNCSICGRKILRGASEYDLHFGDAGTLTLDRICFALWQNEATPETKPADPRAARQP